MREDYAGLAELTDGKRLKAEHIESGVKEYGRTLVKPPEQAYDYVDVVYVEDSSPPQYSIRFALFTCEEGRSDLELQATLIDDGSGATMKVEIDGILVA